MEEDDDDQANLGHASLCAPPIAPVDRVWPSLGVDDPCSAVRWGHTAGVHWQNEGSARAFHALKEDPQRGGAPFVPAANSRVLLKLPNGAPPPSEDSLSDRTGNELAGWVDGTSLVTIFPVGEAQDEIAAIAHELEEPPPRDIEPAQDGPTAPAKGTVTLKRFLRSPSHWVELRDSARYKALAAEAKAAGYSACRATLLQHCLPSLTVEELQRTFPHTNTKVYVLSVIKLLARIFRVRIGRQVVRVRLVESICAAARGSSRARGPAPGLPIQQIVASPAKAWDERTLISARAANAAAFYSVRWDRLGVLQVFPIATIQCGDPVADVVWDLHSGREAAVVSERGAMQLISFSQPEEEGALGEAEGVSSKGAADGETSPGHDRRGQSFAEEAGKAGTSDPVGSRRNERIAEEAAAKGSSVGRPLNEALQYQKAQAVGAKQQVVRRNARRSDETWWRCVYGHNSNSLVVANRTSVTILNLARREEVEVESERCLLEMTGEPRAGAVAWEPGGLVQQTAEAVCALARSENTDGAGRFLVAVATTYRVLLWDTRKGSAPLLQWDHCLSHAAPTGLLFPSFPLGPSPNSRSILAFNSSGDVIGFAYAPDTSGGTPAAQASTPRSRVPLLHALGGPFRVLAPFVDRDQAVVAEPAGPGSGRSLEKKEKEETVPVGPIISGLLALPADGSLRLVQLTGRGQLVERSYVSRTGGEEVGGEERTGQAGGSNLRSLPQGRDSSPETSLSLAAKAKAPSVDTKGYLLQPVPVLRSYVSLGDWPQSLPLYSAPTLERRNMTYAERAHPRSYLYAGAVLAKHKQARVNLIAEKVAEARSQMVGEGGLGSGANEGEGSVTQAGAKHQLPGDPLTSKAGAVTALNAGEGEKRVGEHGQVGGQNGGSRDDARGLTSEKHFASRISRVAARSPYPLTAAEAANVHATRRLPSSLAGKVLGRSHAGTAKVWRRLPGAKHRPEADKLPLVLLAREGEEATQTSSGRGADQRNESGADLPRVRDAVVQLAQESGGADVASVEVSARRFQLSDSFHLHSLASVGGGQRTGGEEGGGAGGLQPGEERAGVVNGEDLVQVLPESPLTAAAHRTVVTAPAEAKSGELSRFRIVRHQGSVLGQEAALSRLADLRAAWRQWQEQKVPGSLPGNTSLLESARESQPTPSSQQTPSRLLASPARVPTGSPLGDTARMSKAAVAKPPKSAKLVPSAGLERLDIEESVPSQPVANVGGKPPRKRSLPEAKKVKKKLKKSHQFTEGF
ncbi:hypothetical protein KFL_000160120 [Klebsormidium nitens]|uniref:Uncharacterized protein n=1 Tax=Klebsormidium nitens TaxID=105231 RepID=A0A1Y1HN51_KLENI|nr:hypothetical protein KFL_000160120 [Klebsormidium nitens]|eukprot:GAQ78609.1 hypothetical protein KFL_000160120 [Klebsormidium nitens]